MAAADCNIWPVKPGTAEPSNQVLIPFALGPFRKGDLDLDPKQSAVSAGIGSPSLPASPPEARPPNHPRTAVTRPASLYSRCRRRLGRGTLAGDGHPLLRVGRRDEASAALILVPGFHAKGVFVDLPAHSASGSQRGCVPPNLPQRHLRPCVDLGSVQVTVKNAAYHTLREARLEPTTESRRSLVILPDLPSGLRFNGTV